MLLRFQIAILRLFLRLFWRPPQRWLVYFEQFVICR